MLKESMAEITLFSRNQAKGFFKGHKFGQFKTRILHKRARQSRIFIHETQQLECELSYTIRLFTSNFFRQYRNGDFLRY